MTWVIGGTSLYSCHCLADIQATLKFHDGTRQYYDVVQKIHMVSPHIMMAFAGDIKMGLCTIAHIKKYYEKNKDERIFSNPLFVANKLLSKIYYCYEKYYTPHMHEYVEFMICISPFHLFLSSLAKQNVKTGKYYEKKAQDGTPIDVEHVKWLSALPGFDAFYNTPHRAHFLSVIYVPNSHAKILNPNTLAHLGCGRVIEDYLKIGESQSSPYAIEKTCDGGKDNLKILNPSHINRIIAQLAENVSHNGISKYMHSGVLSGMGCIIKQCQSKNFPNTVDNWDDFVKIMQEKNIALATCNAEA